MGVGRRLKRMGGNVDTLLTAKEQPDLDSAKSTRRAAIAKDYSRMLVCLQRRLPSS